MEGVPVLLVRLEPLRALAGVAHAPHAAVVFAGDVFQQRLVVLYLDVLEQLVGKAELLAQQIHDLVVDLGFEQGLNHLVAPLHGAVGGGNGTIGLELGGGRQQVDAVGAIVHHRSDGGIRVDNHHHVELLHRLLHFRAAGLGVDRMAPVEHGADVGALLDEIGVLQHPVHPAGDRNAVVVHRQLAVVGLVVKAGLDPLVIDIPHPGPVLPGALFQPVVTGQGIGGDAKVGGALHVVVTAEDVGARPALAHVAEGQFEDAVSAGIVVAGGVLGTAHAPDHAAGAVVGQQLGGIVHLLFVEAGHPLHFGRGPARHLFLHLVHAVDAGADELLVFPAVLEDVPEHAPDKGDVGARTQGEVHVRLGGGAGATRVDHQDLAAVALFRQQDVLHGDRVGLRRVGADKHDRLAVVHVVQAVGHGAVAPGVGDASHRGGVADARLMIHVVGAPQGRHLAKQVGLLVGVLGRAEPVDAVGAGLLAQAQHLIAHLFDGLIPTDALPLAAHQLHRVLEATLTVAVLAQGRPLGAVTAKVEGVIECRLLTGPDTVLHLGIDAAAHRAVGADGALHLDRHLGRHGFGLGPLHHGRCQPTGGHCATGHQTGVDHKGATGQPLTANGLIALLARLGLLGTFRQFHEFSFTDPAQSVPRRVR